MRAGSKSRGLTLLTVLAVASSLLASSAVAAGNGVEGEGASASAPIRLRSGTFLPALGQPALPSGLTTTEAPPGQDGYYLVQFSGPVESAMKNAVEALGAELIDYVPDFAFKVRMDSASADLIGALPEVAWVGVFHPAYKLETRPTNLGPALFRVRIESGVDMGQAVADITSTGARILESGGPVVIVAATALQVEAIANIADAAWIEPYMFREKHNEYGAGSIMGTTAANAAGYDGSTQVVAVADTGFGDGVAATAHPDVPASRITAIHDWPATSSPLCYTAFPDGAQDVDSGHGTHTALSVASDGDAAGEGIGAAPAANLVFQSVEDYIDTFGFCAGSPDGYYLVGLPADLRDLYQQAYDSGARIHSNSWGSDAAGDYTSDSANTDDFQWNNPDLTITFSAGNAGFDFNADGVVDNDSIGSPATAKNVITVGASENDRAGDYSCDLGLGYVSHDAYQPGQTCASMGGQNLLGTYGQRFGFPAAPLFGDITAGNAGQMAAFSSRGPTDDGRIKPDVVAPGTWVLSGYAPQHQEGYGDPVNPQNGLYQWDGWGMPAGDQYKYMGGTSMSNPLAAGGAVVVRDYYQKVDGHAASAALVKATLINTANDLLDENNDGVDDNDFPIPNVHEGWGLVDVAEATSGTLAYIDDAVGLSTGGSASYQFDAGGGPFKVTLVWTDYPSTEIAAQNLVNDLDLVVTAPDGTTTFLGNAFSGGWSQTGGVADTVNNVENVFVQSPAAGTWTVEVVASNVPFGPQPFAVVTNGTVPLPPTEWGFVDFAGGSGSRSITPVPATTNLIDVRAWAALADWTPTSTQSVTGSTGSRLSVRVTPSGRLMGVVRLATGFVFAQSSAVPAVSDGQRLWVRFAFDTTTGDATFYTSEDNTNDPTAVVWTALGATVATGSTGNLSPINQLVVGAANAAPALPMTGEFLGARWDFDGTTYAIDFATTGQLTSTPPDYSQWGPWTLTGAFTYTEGTTPP